MCVPSDPVLEQVLEGIKCEFVLLSVSGAFAREDAEGRRHQAFAVLSLYSRARTRQGKDWQDDFWC